MRSVIKPTPQASVTVGTAIDEQTCQIFISNTRIQIDCLYIGNWDENISPHVHCPSKMNVPVVES